MPPFNGITLRPINPRQQASGARRKSGNYPEAGAGTAKPLTYDHAVSMLAIGNPLDKAIIALALMAGLRRSEIADLSWNDIEESENDTLLIHVRQSKTSRAGQDTDIRLLKNGYVQAVRDLRSSASAHDPRSSARLGFMVNLNKEQDYYQEYQDQCNLCLPVHDKAMIRSSRCCRCAILKRKTSRLRFRRRLPLLLLPELCTRMNRCGFRF
ncbi:MAG: tyrosine-type recombinase/integrase [Gammaproteobacteria bacterium]|nr:tyrosine-type recombinase/integrase [Gammaproteobacteria bacterium]